MFEIRFYRKGKLITKLFKTIADALKLVNKLRLTEFYINNIYEVRV